MADSTLSILVRDRKKPCSPYFTSGHQFYVDILHCDFTPLKWKGTTYLHYKLREKIHDQIKLPPGCYIIRSYAHCNNVVTEMAMVQVGCNSIVCVNLLPTTVRYCIERALVGLRYGTASTMMISEKIPEDKLNKAIEALESVKEYLPKDKKERPDLSEEVEDLLKKEELK